MKLKDKVAIVTGAASGIGAASARLFAAEGARLALVDQDKVGLGQVAADIEAGGGSAFILPADVSSDSEARAGVAQVMEKWGRIDVLLTAAGMSTGGTVDAIEEAAWDRTFAVNVKGTYLWIHYAIQPMIVAQVGRHRDHRLAARAVEPGQERRLCRLQGRHRLAHQDDRRRPRRAGHPRQRPDAGRHRHAHAGQVAHALCRSRGDESLVEAAPSHGPHRPAGGSGEGGAVSRQR